MDEEYGVFSITETGAYDDPAEIMERCEALAEQEWAENGEHPLYAPVGHATYVRERTNYLMNVMVS